MKFGVREIVDVVFKATANGQKIGTRTFKKYQPGFMIDTATTSSLEQSTTTVYAQGGKGYARLIAWEGEKTMTFTVTDALMSPMGLAVLTGAGLINPSKGSEAHVHTTINTLVNDIGEARISLEELNEEFGLDADDYAVCKTIEMFATELDGSGAGINWFDNVTVSGGDSDNTDYVHVTRGNDAIFTVPGAVNTTVQLDFYTIMNNSVTEVQIEPGSFGGYFYIEAQTLFRREDTGKDMAAEIIIPKAKVQSAFTFTMAASGDPSTFDFVMDAFPGYTRFDNTKKQMCVIQIVGDDKKAEGESDVHKHEDGTFDNVDSPSYMFNATVGKVTADKAETTNQDKITVTKNGNDITVTVNDTLESIVPKGTAWPAGKWVALDFGTGENTIQGIHYKSLTNGSEVDFGASDIAEANEYGLSAGHFVLWVREDGNLPAEFELTKAGKEKLSVSVNFA